MNDSRPVVWSHEARVPGWSSYWTTAGGSLRAFRGHPDVRPDATSAAVVWHTATEGMGSEEAKFAGLLLRRILTRGDAPPADPMVEHALLDRLGLTEHLAPPRTTGDLCGKLAPGAPFASPDELLRAARHRIPFVLEPNLVARSEPLVHPDAERPFLLTSIPTMFGETAGHWVVPQAPLDQLAGEHGRVSGLRRVDFLLAQPGFPPMVIEIDGQQHKDEAPVDTARTALLRGAGYLVNRIGASDAKAGRTFDAAELGDWTTSDGVAATDQDLLLVWGAAVAHRIGLGMVEALERGWVSGRAWSVHIAEPLGVLEVAVLSFLEQLDAIDSIYSLGIAPASVTVEAAEGRWLYERTGPASYQVAPLSEPVSATTVTIAVEPFAGPFHALPPVSRIPQVVIRSVYLPVRIVDPRHGGGLRRSMRDGDRVPSAVLVRMLQAIFAKAAFRPDNEAHPRKQEVALRRLLSDKDAVVLLPTGAGKSLIYQLAGMLRSGTTLIVDPIIALIHDQIDGLHENGIDRAIGIWAAGRDVIDARLDQIRSGEALFCFISPERMQSARFREALSALTVASPVSIAVVDEAHCVSEWGHDFRTSYLSLGRVLRRWCADAAGVPPVIPGLTGTASRSVLRDALVELDVDRSDPDLLIIPDSFDRGELRFDIVRAEDDVVIPRLVGALRSLPAIFGRAPGEFFQPRGDDTAAGIVFCPTIDGRTGVTDVAKAIAEELRVPVARYSGASPRGFVGNWNLAKAGYADDFKRDRAAIMVATNAYGAGIDKPNVRWIIHVGIPGSIEAYYQEAGRAGRDGRPATCILIHHPAAREFYEWTHGNAYPGIPSELAAIRWTLIRLAPLDRVATVQIPFPRTAAGEGDGGRVQHERAIYRLMMLGVLRDYTVDHGGRLFEVELAEATPERVWSAVIEYVRRAEPGRVPWANKTLGNDIPTDLHAATEAAADVLLTYVYDTLVPARARATNEMEELADRSRGDADIRAGILNYLELGRFGREIDALVDQEPFVGSHWLDLYAQVMTVDDAMEMRGSTARMLESTPYHPGLLLGRASAEALLADGDAMVFMANATLLLRDAPERYALSSAQIDELADWLGTWTRTHRREWAHLTYLALEAARPDDSIHFMRDTESVALRDTAVEEAAELAVILNRRLKRLAPAVEAIVEAMRT